jgi:hypothetical protein
MIKFMTKEANKRHKLKLKMRWPMNETQLLRLHNEVAWGERLARAVATHAVRRGIS